MYALEAVDPEMAQRSGEFTSPLMVVVSLYNVTMLRFRTYHERRRRAHSGEAEE